MPIKDLRDKYGDTKGPKLVNRAIRAEVIGGNECLDGLEQAHFLARKLRARNYRGADEAESVIATLNKIRDYMADEIERRYGMGPYRE